MQKAMQLLKEALAEMDYQQQLPESRCIELSNAIAEADAAETWLEKALAVQAERRKESS